MSTKYHVQRLAGTWAVVMTASNQIIESFQTESECIQARGDFEGGGRAVVNISDVWLVDNSFVCEPYVGGQMLGEMNALDMKQFNVVKKMSQKQFDKLVSKAIHQGEMDI